MKRNFECVLIVPTDIGDQSQEAIFQKITNKIESLDGKIIDSKVWIKERNLCYFLKSKSGEKKKYTKGCYWLSVFSIDTDKLSEIRETIRLEEKILRSLIVRSKDSKGSTIEE